MVIQICNLLLISRDKIIKLITIDDTIPYVHFRLNDVLTGIYNSVVSNVDIQKVEIMLFLPNAAGKPYALSAKKI